MASTVSFDSPLAKTIMLLAAVGILIWIISKQCNWGGPKTIENFELEPVTFGMGGESYEDDDEGMEGYYDEDEEAEAYYNDDEDEEAYEDEDVEEYEDDDEEGFEDEEMEEYNDDEYY